MLFLKPAVRQNTLHSKTGAKLPVSSNTYTDRPNKTKTDKNKSNN